MADPNSTSCAACGASGELHEHHLVPRVLGGRDLPTVMLCLACHGLVHGRAFAIDHASLTKAGLAAAKARGVKLGSVQAVKGFDGALSRKGRETQSARSAARLAELLPHVRAAQAAGCTTQREIAQALTARGIRTPQGGEVWHVSQVQRVLAHAPAKPGTQPTPAG